MQWVFQCQRKKKLSEQKPTIDTFKTKLQIA